MTTFVLVHGAWCDSRYWDETAARLDKQGHTVYAVNLPSSGTDPAALGSLAEDAAAVRRAVETAAEPVVLVGHSWGGMVITELAGHPLVAHSVYLSAFWPERGQSVLDLLGEGPLPAFVGTPRPDGSVPVTEDVELAHELLCADLPADRVDDWYQQLLLANGAVFTAPSSAPDRRHTTTYIVLEQDRAIPPAAQEAMARNADRVERMAGSHGVMLSDPDAVANTLVRITS
jgi:pimeloyl-ACP methyl ester carboxylesterase